MTDADQLARYSPFLQSDYLCTGASGTGVTTISIIKVALKRQ